MKYKDFLLSLVNDELKSLSIEKDRVYLMSIQKKILGDENLLHSEKQYLVDNVVSNHILFDGDGEPIGNTLLVESLIDFLNNDNTW